MLARKYSSPEPGDLAGRVDTLRKVSLFEDLWGSTQALEALGKALQERKFSSGDSIIREGDVGSELFVLIKGQASVFKKTAAGDEYRVAILLGDHHAFFGEGALLDSDSRSATIRADDECVCIMLSRPGFDDFCTGYPNFALPVLRRIARAVMARLSKSNGDLLLLYNALISEIRGY